MEIYTQQQELKKHLQTLKNQGKTIGFAPTMGALHQGHISLIIKSLAENDVTVVSIFVNPTQFNNSDDLKKYPRTLTADMQLISQISDEVIIYAPEPSDIYGDNVVSEKFDFEGLDKVMEGAFRPGHFDGVGTVVKKLFEIVTPQKAYFGEKDFQQLQIIKKMVAQTSLPVQIIECPIVRAENGLALSSRNERLSPAMKQTASFIYQTLQQAKKMFENQTPKEVEHWVKSEFKKSQVLDLEYFTIADVETLLTATEKEQGKNYRAFIAVYAEGVRLIDTMAF